MLGIRRDLMLGMELQCSELLTDRAKLLTARFRWFELEQNSDFFGMPKGSLIEEQLFHSVIGSFYEAYNALGFGFLERACALALERELRARSHEVAREVSMLIMYKGEPLFDQRIDMIVDRRLIVEIKSTETLHSSAARQVYNYLRATGLEIGLLLHFGPQPRFKRIFCRTARADVSSS